MYTYVDRQCQYSVLNQIKSYYIKLFFDFTPYQIIYIYLNMNKLYIMMMYYHILLNCTK